MGDVPVELLFQPPRHILTKYKKVDTQRGNLSSRSADPELFIPASVLVKGAIYQVRSWLLYTATAAADVNQGWVGPTGATMVWAADNLAAGQAAGSAIGSVSKQGLTAITSSNTLGGIGTPTTLAGSPAGTLTIGSNLDVDFALAWSAVTAGIAADAVLLTGSWISLMRMK